MPIGKVWIYRLLFVCLCVCTVKDFSADDKASGVKFCTVVRRRPGQGIAHSGELCSAEAFKEAQNRTNRLRREILPIECISLLYRKRHATDAPFVCVDIRPSPKTDILV